MATEESIELATPSSVPTEAETTPPRPFKTRSLTVSAAGPGTRLRIEGLWLEEAGFEHGVRVKVHVEHGRLIVEAQAPAVPEPAPEPRAHRRSWVHDYPHFKPPNLSDKTIVPSTGWPDDVPYPSTSINEK